MKMNTCYLSDFVTQNQCYINKVCCSTCFILYG